MGHSRIGSPGCQAPLTLDERKPMTREFCFDDPRAGDIAYLMASDPAGHLEDSPHRKNVSSGWPRK